eukprot:501526_1
MEEPVSPVEVEEVEENENVADETTVSDDKEEEATEVKAEETEEEPESAPVSADQANVDADAEEITPDDAPDDAPDDEIQQAVDVSPAEEPVSPEEENVTEKKIEEPELESESETEVAGKEAEEEKEDENEPAEEEPIETKPVDTTPVDTKIEETQTDNTSTEQQPITDGVDEPSDEKSATADDEVEVEVVQASREIASSSVSSPEDTATTNEIEGKEPAPETTEEVEDEAEIIPTPTSYYTLEELLSPIDDVDWAKREHYLSDDDIQKHFGMSRNELIALPKWKRVSAKKDLGIF